MLAVVVLLGSDSGGGLGADRDQLPGSDFEVAEAQAGTAGAVVDDRAELQGAGIAAAQAGLDQHHDHVPRRDGREAGKAGGRFELGHDELRDEPRELAGAVGEFFLVDDGIVRQPGQPVVAPAGVEEDPQHAQRQQPGVDRPRAGGEP